MGRTACTEPQCLYKGAFYLYLTVSYMWTPQVACPGFPDHNFVSTSCIPCVLHALERSSSWIWLYYLQLYEEDRWHFWFHGWHRPHRTFSPSSGSASEGVFSCWSYFNSLNPELNPICYLLALLGAHHFLHVNRIRVKLLTFRLLMSYIYIWSTHSWCF